MNIFHCPEHAKEIKEILEQSELTTLIRPNVLERDIEKAVSDAMRYGIRSVAALPPQAEKVCEALAGTGIRTTCVYDMLSGAISRPEATTHSVMKLAELGVDEFDFMISLPELAAGNYEGVAAHWKQYADLVHARGRKLFATLEKGFFDDAAVTAFCGLAAKAGADGVRTVTGCQDLSGINGGRVTIHDVCLMRKVLPENMDVKASGGTDYMYLEDAHALLACGAASVDLGDCALSQLAAIGYEKEA